MNKPVLMYGVEGSSNEKPSILTSVATNVGLSKSQFGVLDFGIADFGGKEKQSIVEKPLVILVADGVISK